MFSKKECNDCDGDCLDCESKKANPIAVMVLSQRFFEQNRLNANEALQTQEEYNKAQSAIQRRLAGMQGE